MKKFGLYLETSVWNFLFADDAPEKKASTLTLFNEIETGKHTIYISEIVINEIKRAPEQKKDLLIDAMNKFRPVVLRETGETQTLVQHYLSNKLLSEGQLADLGHVAIASVNAMDLLVSWNMRHIVKHRTRIMVNALNQLAGYRPIEICTPEEVIDNEY